MQTRYAGTGRRNFSRFPGILAGHFWRIEQTLFALCSSRYGVELLPEEYTLRLEPGLGGRCFRHYVGEIRHLMYCEGVAQLAKDGFLNRGVQRGDAYSLKIGNEPRLTVPPYTSSGAEVARSYTNR